MSQRKIYSVPPELDFASEFFDPVKALACRNLYLPFPNAKTYNNVAEYYSHTFVKRGEQGNNAKVKESPQERNYEWYYSTLNCNSSRGNRYYAQMNKRINKWKRRSNKKAISTSIIPSEPMRSEKVVNIKSDYKIYCKRKFSKWLKASPPVTIKQCSNTAFKSLFPTVNTSPEQLWASKPNEIASNQPDSRNLALFIEKIFKSQIKETSHRDKEISSKFPLLVNATKDVNPLSLLEQVLFRQVALPPRHTDATLTVSQVHKDMNITGDCNELYVERGASKVVAHLADSSDLRMNVIEKSKSSQFSHGFINKSEANHFLCENVKINVNRKRKSCSEIPSKANIGSSKVLRKWENSGADLSQPSKKSDNRKLDVNTCKTVTQSNLSDHKKILRSKENNFLHEDQRKNKLASFADDQVKSKLDVNSQNDKQSIIVRIDRSLVTVRSLKVKSIVENFNLKENKMPNNCTCNAKISTELSSQCSCGFYSSAMNQVHKFKIPLKRAVSNVSKVQKNI